MTELRHTLLPGKKPINLSLGHILDTSEELCFRDLCRPIEIDGKKKPLLSRKLLHIQGS